jgi:nitrate reductase gamma subunit
MLWVLVPYVALTMFVGGHIWRYRTDRFGWTARSSQLHEQRLLRLGSPLFHGGILATLAGHIVGLLVPARLTRALGLPDGVYHTFAVGVGGLAGVATVTGLAILVYRRVTVRGVARGAPASDRLMYPLLIAVIVSGLAITLLGAGHDYRATVSPWFRSILTLHPDTAAIARAPFGFQLHALLAWALIACWPFTRLVHAWSAPLEYLFRPYIVYRSRDPRAVAGRGRTRGGLRA